MRLLRACSVFLITVCLVLSLLPAMAENLLTVDMLHGSSYLHTLPNLLDGDEKTAWTSAKGGEQYLQITVPEGDTFTLTLRWGRVPKRLRLIREQDGRWVELFSHAYDEELPEHFVLSPGGHAYHLVAQGTLSISELSLAQGEVVAPTATPTLESTVAVTIAPMLTPTDTPMPTITLTPVPTAAPTDTPTPTIAPTPVPTDTPAPTDTPTASPIAAALPTLIPTEVPATPSPVPTAEPTPASIAALEAAPVASTMTPAPPTIAPTEDMPSSVFTDMPLTLKDDAGAVEETTEPTEEPPAEQAVSYDASALLEYLRSKVGRGYLDGCSGELCSLALRAEKAQLYPDHAEGILGVAQKWDGIEVYDSAGLLAGFLASVEDEQETEGWQSDLDNTLAQWHLDPRPLETMPIIPGILLLHEKEGGGYDRIGVYTGGGKSVHARGYAYGVVEEQMPYVWTHWATPDWLQLDLAEETDISFQEQYMATGTSAKVDTRDGELVVLYVEPAGDDGLIGTGYGILNHTLVDIVEAPEAAPDWRKISYTDITGVVTTGYVRTEDLRVPVQ